MKGSYSICIVLTATLCTVGWLSSCDEKPRTERASEVAFRIDSSYFNFMLTDTFHGMTLPSLLNFRKDTLDVADIDKPVYMLSNDRIKMAVLFSAREPRESNSYRYYKDAEAGGHLEGELLNIDNFSKDQQKLTQLILRKDGQIIFKIIKDTPSNSLEMDIHIAEENYNEQNILLTESIIGQINFITK